MQYEGNSMITIIFKATDNCNSKCKYCHAIYAEHNGIQVMPHDILKQFFIRANEFLVENPEERLNIVWHGGEPLTLDPDFFYKAIDFKETYCKHTNERISFEMQSNLTLLTPKYIDVLKKLKLRTVGSSFEPIPGIRGWGGIKGSENYNKKFLEAVNLLELEGFSWGIIYVVTKLALKDPLAIYHQLCNLVPSSSIMFNPVTYQKGNSNDIGITPEEFVDFLGCIFKEWWQNNSRLSGIEPFNSLVDNIIKGNRSNLICVDSGKCANTHISISPDGSVWQCGRASDWGLMKYGSIIENSISEIMNHQTKNDLRKRSLILKNTDCADCRFWSICHGGCPLDSLNESGTVMKKTPWCFAKKGFIEKYFEPITGVSFENQNQDTKNSETSTSSLEFLPTKKPYNDILNMFNATKKKKNDFPWITGIKNLEDALVTSGVLKQLFETDSSNRFNIEIPTSFKDIFYNHPAIVSIGSPPENANTIEIDDNIESLSHSENIYNYIANIIKKDISVKSEPYSAWTYKNNFFIKDIILWKSKNILICPFSDSPKKEMNISKWEKLTKMLINDGFGVMQFVNRLKGHVRGAYSVIGIERLNEISSFVRNFDLIITSHNIFVHIAKLNNIPAVVLWGPTDCTFYGYPEQINIKSSYSCPNLECINKIREHRALPCPFNDKHCMNFFDLEFIYNKVVSII